MEDGALCGRTNVVGEVMVGGREGRGRWRWVVLDVLGIVRAL